jgi:hypothetical protein
MATGKLSISTWHVPIRFGVPSVASDNPRREKSETLSWFTCSNHFDCLRSPVICGDISGVDCLQ